MKITLATIVLLAMTSVGFAQEKGIEFGKYPLKIEWKKADLSELPNPSASTDCKESKLTWIYADKAFSGGENGVLERTWIAEDSCGSKASTVQYIVLKD